MKNYYCGKLDDTLNEEYFNKIERKFSQQKNTDQFCKGKPFD